MTSSAPGTKPSSDLTTNAAPASPQLSVVMCTFNRGELLQDAVRSVLAQHDAITPSFEMIVVDNNSTDGTHGIVDRITREDDRVRYLFEPRQGLSFARNAALQQARAPLVAFTDDDVRAEPDWVAAVVRAFRDHPEADLVGGRVLPVWPMAPPAWLTREHWGPLALVDHGDAPFTITAGRPVCLVGANMAIRMGAFADVGLFATDLQRVKEGIGSLEDHDFLLRLLRSGRRAVYDPRIVVHAEVQPDRLERMYHRRWHSGHGHFHALLSSEQMEQTSVGTLFGVPAHMYRQALGDAVGWMRATLARSPAAAFRHEAGLRFFRGFLQTRRRQFREKPRHERPGELRRLLRAVLPRLGALPRTGRTRIRREHG